MTTLNFSFSPGVGYTDPYTIVAYGHSNSSIPVGQVTISGYGSTVTGNITTSSTDTPFEIKIYTAPCANPVGTYNY